MKRSILCGVLVVGLCATAFAKRDPDVDKALKRQYPDAQTQILNSYEINGVKVNHVKVTTKQGESDADVTENGDFLRYGIPREHTGPFIGVLQTNTQGLFKTAPTDVDMYRVTNYIAELQGPGGKMYQAVFDAVGRLQDLSSHRAMAAESQQMTSEAKASGQQATEAENFAKKYSPDIKVQGVYKSHLGDNFYDVRTDNGNILVSSTGQVYSIREQVADNEVPKAVNDAIGSLFNKDKVSKIYRTEWEYYSFNEQTNAGQPVTIWMRPNGDIIKVVTPGTEEAQPTLAGHKQHKAKNQ